MKKNCQLYTAKGLFKAMFSESPAEDAQVRIDGEGNLCWYREDRERASVLAGNCAYQLNMPLWEVVMVDVDGFDEFAVLMYENA